MTKSQLAKLSKARRAMYDDGCPLACLIPMTDKERTYWRSTPPTVIPVFQLTPRNETPETIAFRAAEEERRRLKSLAGIQRMKNRFAAKAIDYSKMRWDARRNKFVPLTGDKPVTESVPTVTAPRRGSAAPARVEITPVGTDIPRVTKDNAEAVAKLNGVWKPEYEKLRGTGRIVMTVGNVLKGLVKRGGTVKWQ